jgi:hypothetical protein
MPALTKPYEAQEKEGLWIAYPIKANAKIWKGALVCADNTGYLVPAADVSGYKFVGVALESVDNTDGTDGAKKCRVIKRGTFVYNRSGTYTQADVGAVVKAVSDNDVAKSSTHNINVGTVVELPANQVRIRVDNYTL